MRDEQWTTRAEHLVTIARSRKAVLYSMPAVQSWGSLDQSRTTHGGVEPREKQPVQAKQATPSHASLDPRTTTQIGGRQPRAVQNMAGRVRSFSGSLISTCDMGGRVGL